jgi:hypothetical protein
MELKQTEKSKGGRPTGYTEEIGDEICARVLAGETINEICAGQDMPPVRTLYGWLKQVPAFEQAYARARAESGQASEGKIRGYMRQVVTGELDSTAARVLIDAEKWLASKRAPRTHGDRVEVEHSGTVGQAMQVTVNVVGYDPSPPAIDVVPTATALPTASVEN